MFLNRDMRSMYFMTWQLCLVCLLLHLLSVLFREKFLRLTMGFGYFMYSHSLVPVIDLWISGRDKVSIRAMVSLLIFELSFCVFLHHCGIRLSNVSSVIIASSILRCFCFTVMFWFYLVCLPWMGRRAQDAPAAEVADNVEQSF